MSSVDDSFVCSALCGFRKEKEEGRAERASESGEENRHAARLNKRKARGGQRN